jgi:hypothetical protein
MLPTLASNEAKIMNVALLPTIDDVIASIKVKGVS